MKSRTEKIARWRGSSRTWEGIWMTTAVEAALLMTFVAVSVAATLMLAG